ncbi:SDR family NAD(P)-dependent oxidoreductase [Galactobacter valiniphilus]|uniref:SDR family NAD(P)-dependent oxidoreductase n=1 Tax=Galactobacter valiniphilus TaxID=2676122 RepID=UPI0037362A3A
MSSTEPQAPHRTALVTGATSGIGLEFARELAAQGRHLILVARDRDRLAAVAAELEGGYAIHTESIVADLLDEAGQEAVIERLLSHVDPVELLVNNAGYGLVRSFADNTWDEERDHWRIHTEVPLRLAHAALQAMRERGGGRIINVASVAAFTPRGTYSASKLAMVNFSKWATLHHAEDGLVVTALCPGFTRTEFHERMGQDTKAFPRLAWLKAEDVVRQGLADSAAGRSLSIPSLRYKIARVAASVLPAKTVERMVRRN